MYEINDVVDIFYFCVSCVCIFLSSIRVDATMMILLHDVDRNRLPVHGLRLPLLLLVAFIQFVTSFPPEVLWALSRSCHSSRSELQHFVVNEKAVQVDTSDATLVFRADYVYVSDPAPLVSPERMLDFFRDSKNRDCLLTAGDRLESHTIDTSNDLLEKWKSKASTLEAAEPDASDVIINVRTGRIHFPGLTVDTTALIGSKLILPPEATSFPNYEFILIQDKRSVSGLKPIVWAFNRLMAPSKKEGRDTAPFSLTRVFALPSEDGKTVKFKTHTFLEVRVSFPAFLLKLIPSSKEKAEAQGSEALIKTLKKDIDVAVDKFRANWVDFSA